MPTHTRAERAKNRAGITNAISRVGSRVRNTRSRALSALSTVRDRVIDKTSDVLSAPKRAFFDAQSRGANRRFTTFRAANDARGVQDKGNESDPLFRARAVRRNAQFDALNRGRGRGRGRPEPDRFRTML